VVPGVVAGIEVLCDARRASLPACVI